MGWVCGLGGKDCHARRGIRIDIVPHKRGIAWSYRWCRFQRRWHLFYCINHIRNRGSLFSLLFQEFLEDNSEEPRCGAAGRRGRTETWKQPSESKTLHYVGSAALQLVLKATIGRREQRERIFVTSLKKSRIKNHQPFVMAEQKDEEVDDLELLGRIDPVLAEEVEELEKEPANPAPLDCFPLNILENPELAKDLLCKECGKVCHNAMEVQNRLTSDHGHPMIIGEKCVPRHLKESAIKSKFARSQITKLKARCPRAVFFQTLPKKG